MITCLAFPPPRLTDPVPTMETSIAPRSRPKAGGTQPIGILPIQPALTPRKRPNVAAGGPQPIGTHKLPSVLALFLSQSLNHKDLMMW